MRRFAALCSALSILAFAAPPAFGQAATEGEHSPNMEFVKNIPYELRNGATTITGTDIEFTRIGGRQYALAGSYMNGMQIVDITNPRESRIVSVYDCGVTQGDVQVFRQASKPGRVFVSYASDTTGDGTSTCYQEAAALGFEVKKPNGSGKNGSFIAEITDPLHPTTVSFVEVAQGTHNGTIHPSGNYLYNSNSDLITSLATAPPAIEVFDITNFAAPAKVNELTLPIHPGLGTESHDITFKSDGTRAYSAALSQGVVIDTTDPANPSMISSFTDPAINVWHQMDPYTTTDASGRERTFLLAEDEVAGAAGGNVCPSGGFHVYEVTGELEREPVKVGYWNIDDVGLSSTDPTGTCTAHVFRIHEREKLMTAAFYNGGVRVVDLTGLEGISLGSTQVVGEGMKEIGYYRMPDADTWSAKTPQINRKTGDFYLFGNDIARGLDIYHFDGEGTKPAKSRGKWMSAQEAKIALAGRPAPGTAGTTYICLLDD
jgi:hypothetical protein